MILKGTASCEHCGANAQVWYQIECKTVLCPNCAMEIRSQYIVTDLSSEKPSCKVGKVTALGVIFRSIRRMAACL